MKSNNQPLLKTSLSVTVATLALPAVSYGQQSHVKLGELVVEGPEDQAGTYQPKRMDSPKYTAPLRDIPQSIAVVPAALIEQQNAQTLEEILRNVPGITFNSGEGNGGLGDSLNIRGFSGDGNIYRDGVRDVAKYTRSEIFNIEQVEVVKGASSSTWGSGAIGGAVNLVTKAPMRQELTRITGGLGTADYKRMTLDANRYFADFAGGTAIRLNLVGHESGVDGRNWIRRERNGFAPSVEFGMDTDTRLKLSYEYINDYGNVDYGIPTKPVNGNAHRYPGVKWDSYWGYRNLDEEHNKSHRLNMRFEHDFNDWIRIDNHTAYGKVDRTYTVTTPSGTVGNPKPSLRRLRGVSRDSTNEVWTNQTNLRFDFNTGFIRHELVTGFEYTREKLDLKSGGLANPSPIQNRPQDPSNPDSKYPGDTSIAYTSDLGAKATTKAFYVMDTLKFSDHWQLHLSARQDHYKAENTRSKSRRVGQPWTHDYAAENVDDNQKLTSVHTALMFKPVEYGTFYISYANARQPNSLTSVSQFGVSEGNIQKGKTYEIGTKWDLFHERLSLTAAIFKSERSLTYEDEISGQTYSGNGKEEVKGLDLGAAGKITNNWSVYAGYAYQDSEAKKAVNQYSESGLEVKNTPKHSFNLWTTYKLPYNFSVSYGARYIGEVYINPGRGENTTKADRIKVPDAWVHDVAVQYDINEKANVRLNLNNIFNKHYWQKYNGRGFGQPGAGFGAIVTAEYNF